jgi:hypothetical protein
VNEILSPLIAAPVFPASILLVLVGLWSLATVVLGLGHDYHIFSGHVDAPSGGGGGGGSLQDTASHHLTEAVGITVLSPIRWLNLNTVPFFLWTLVFASVWWIVSLTLWLVMDRPLLGDPGWMIATGLLVKNIAISLPVTKLLTQPFRNIFAGTEGLAPRSLIGEEAEIWSYDATASHGQARFKTDGAPLLLNVKTDGPTLVKGTKVWIAHYDETKRVYIVSATTTNNQPLLRE